MPVTEQNHKIFKSDNTHFEAMALEIFRFQYRYNPVYKNYTDALGVDPGSIQVVEQIPFLPIRFFKTHEVRTGSFEPATIFESSGTTGSINSRHWVKDIILYEQSFIKTFEIFYGSIKEYCIIGLLPSYLERQGSSLVYMVDKLINLSEHPQSRFCLHEYEQLFTLLGELEKRKQKTLLIGVTFALLDFAKEFPLPLKHTILMETGGMKGRREELIRPEVHRLLKEAFGVAAIHSEYGMTELLSQAYSKGEGLFFCPPWMKMFVRDEEDPLHVRSGVGSRKLETALQTPDYRLPTLTGALNIIDLANIHSCSFIATDDIGKLNNDGSFEVLGRMDGSDLRGCSLLVV